MDILFENGTIRTLERNSPDAQALLVRNGRIAAVGGRTAVEDQTGIDVRRVDLAGRTLLPAFLDAHSHFTAVANQFLQVSLEGCTSWADMQDRIRDYIRRERIPAGQWVTAQGYDHNLLSERRHPDRLCLDAAAPDNPVVICHQSGHMGVFNTAALERLGVTAQTPAPAGGVIGRENGTLTGYMEENAFLEFQKRVPMRPLESFLAAYRKAQDLYASYGITTVQEGLLRRELVPLYQALLADGSLSWMWLPTEIRRERRRPGRHFPRVSGNITGASSWAGTRCFWTDLPRDVPLGCGGPIRGSRNTGATAP